MEMTDRPEEFVAEPAGLDGAKQRPLSLFGMVNLNVFWLANQFHWQALLAVVLPSMIAHFLDPANKAINLTIVVTLGTVVAFIVNPLVGALSDYARFRMGRRRPFMIIGTFFNIIVLLIFAFSPSWFPSSVLLLVFTILFLLLQFTNNFANSPWSAIIADKVIPAQRGFASGLNGLLTLLGTALGSIIAGMILGGDLKGAAYSNAVVQIFLLICVVQIVVVAYTVIMVKETPLPPEAQLEFSIKGFFQKFFFHPARYPNLSWVLLARFLVMMGIWSVFYFLVYYFGDVLGGPGVKTIIFNSPFTGEQFNGALFQPAVLLFALPTSFLAGWASDHWGRKGMVYLSGAMMTVVCIIFILFQNQVFALIAGAFFGIAYGAYTAVDWALTTDVLPPTGEAGKFMGLWTAMGILPQVAGTAVGGVVLQVLSGVPNHFNYTALFILTVVYLVLGTVVIRQVKGVR